MPTYQTQPLGPCHRFASVSLDRSSRASSLLAVALRRPCSPLMLVHCCTLIMSDTMHMHIYAPAIIRQQIARYLILEEQFDQPLCQSNLHMNTHTRHSSQQSINRSSHLFGQCTTRQSQQTLELWLDLNEQHAKQRRLELHRAYL